VKRRDPDAPLAKECFGKKYFYYENTG